MPKYKVIRMFQKGNHPPITIKKGLTKEEAREHCSNPETSSLTCKGEAGLELTRIKGPWFDGYDEE